MPKRDKATKSGTPFTKKILNALRDEGQERLQRLVELGYDELVDQPLGRLIDLDLLMSWIDLGTNERLTSEVIARYLKPAAGNERVRAQESREHVEAWLRPQTAADLEEILRQPFPLNPEIVDEMVDQKAVRSMLGGVLQEALQGFVSRSKLPGISKGADLMGALGRRASKGLLGGMGKGIERQLEKTVTDFVDQSMARLTRKLAEIAVSDSGQRMLSAMSTDLWQKASRTRLSFYYEEAAKLPADDLWALLPPLLAHNLSRPEIQQALRGELRAALEQEAERPARELLKDLGIEQEVRRLALETVLPKARTIVDSAAFDKWLTELLGG